MLWGWCAKARASSRLATIRAEQILFSTCALLARSYNHMEKLLKKSTRHFSWPGSMDRRRRLLDLSRAFNVYAHIHYEMLKNTYIKRQLARRAHIHSFCCCKVVQLLSAAWVYKRQSWGGAGAAASARAPPYIPRLGRCWLAGSTHSLPFFCQQDECQRTHMLLFFFFHVFPRLP